MKKLRKLLHDWLGWHKPDLYVRFDGCSFTSTCAFCCKRILQDSQGGWFLAGIQEPEKPKVEAVK